MERELHLHQVARLHLEGLEQIEIAEKLGCTQQQISYDILKIREQWRQSTVRDFDEARDEEIAKVNYLERQYYEAWNKSKQDVQKTVTEKTKETTGEKGSEDGKTEKDRAQAVVVKETQLPDPRYAQGIQWCINKRAELMGLNAPEKIAPTDPTGTREYRGEELTAEEKVRLNELITKRGEGTASTPDEGTGDEETGEGTE